MEETKRDVLLDIQEIPKLGQWITLSIQHLFAMFGATVLVPFLVGLSPAVALISSGLGTLAYLINNKRSNSCISWFIICLYYTNHSCKSIWWT